MCLADFTNFYKLLLLTEFVKVISTTKLSQTSMCASSSPWTPAISSSGTAAAYYNSSATFYLKVMQWMRLVHNPRQNKLPWTACRLLATRSQRALFFPSFSSWNLGYESWTHAQQEDHMVLVKWTKLYRFESIQYADRKRTYLPVWRHSPAVYPRRNCFTRLHVQVDCTEQSQFPVPARWGGETMWVPWLQWALLCQPCAGSTDQRNLVYIQTL